MSRGLRAALAGCLVSGALVLLGAGRVWATVTYPDRPRSVNGSALVASLSVWGVVALAGVVADSDPAAEDAECRNKAAAVLTAIRAAETLRPVR